MRDITSFHSAGPLIVATKGGKKVQTQIAKENGESLKCERSPTGTKAIPIFDSSLIMPPLHPQTEQIIFLIQKNKLILLCLFHFISSKPLWGSAPFIPVLWKIFILQIFSTAMPTKCEKSGGALHLPSVSAGAHHGGQQT